MKMPRLEVLIDSCTYQPFFLKKQIRSIPRLFLLFSSGVSQALPVSVFKICKDGIPPSEVDVTPVADLEGIKKTEVTIPVGKSRFILHCSSALV